MKEHERNRLEAALKKMLEDLAQVEEKRSEAREKPTMTRPVTGNVIRRRKGKKEIRLTANVSDPYQKSPTGDDCG
jgi:hypothetical protein